MLIKNHSVEKLSAEVFTTFCLHRNSACSVKYKSIIQNRKGIGCVAKAELFTGALLEVMGE